MKEKAAIHEPANEMNRLKEIGLELLKLPNKQDAEIIVTMLVSAIKMKLPSIVRFFSNGKEYGKIEFAFNKNDFITEIIYESQKFPYNESFETVRKNEFVPYIVHYANQDHLRTKYLTTGKSAQGSAGSKR